MFDETIVVQSAVSAFNNAALSAPAFLWYGILAMPLFILAFYCGNSFLKRLGWGRDNITQRTALTTVVMTFVWVLLFGGNYSVLRDQISVLPYLNALVVFLISLFVASHMRNIKLSTWRGATRRMRVGIVLMWVLVLAALAVSDMHAWWGPVLQIGAFLSGLLLGRHGRSEMPPVAGSVIIMTMVVVAILMQPEFFRFGQLGNLTFLHMLGLLIFGLFVVATVVVGNIKSAGRIHHSAYVKLKWLARFVALLGGALFFLTESVPLFVGFMAAVAVLIALSVWHADSLSDDLMVRLWICVLGAFGVITTMPAVTALGIAYWATLPADAGFFKQLRRLL